MSALFDENDPVADAEAIVAAAPPGYVGRRRANEDGTPMARLDEHTMAELVESRVCWYLGDRDGWRAAHDRAWWHLHRLGYDEAAFAALMRHVGEQVDGQAQVTIKGLASVKDRLASAVVINQLWPDIKCPDPDGHAVAFRNVVRWMNWRKATGQCARCSGWLR